MDDNLDGALSLLEVKRRNGLKVDDREFEDFYSEWYQKVVGVAARITRSPAAGDDIASEAFARAYARWWRLRDVDYRHAWVLRVAINLAVRSLRKPPVAQVRDEGSAHLDEIVVARADLETAMLRLPRRQREVLALRYLADLSEDDVARMLNISRGSVKSHAHRGVVTLRTTIVPREA